MQVVAQCDWVSEKASALEGASVPVIVTIAERARM
jgi:hypothetical protein